MSLNQEDINKVIKFVKQEPKTIQEISKILKRSWVTTDSYVQQIKERTGLINIKIFRKGTQGALKLVYYDYKESLVSEDLKEKLFNQIKNGTEKKDVDFFDIFQYIPDKKKKVIISELNKNKLSATPKLSSFLRQAERVIYCFSGNMSFINVKEGKTTIIKVFEELLKRKVMIKIICRVDLASINNISKVEHLLKKYPELIEIKNCAHPLRGFIIDENIGRFNNIKDIANYREGELNKDMRIFYEIYDEEWILWLQKIFWSLFRNSLDFNTRLKQFKKFF